MASTNLTTAELSEDHSKFTTVAICFGIALPVIAVTLRLCARKIQGLRLKADDYTIMLAAVLTIGNSCVPILANKGGNGRHEETLTKDDLEKYFLALFIFEQTFGVAVAAVKISVLLLYRRIFITQSFRISTTIIGVLVIMWVIVKSLVGAFQCTPVRKAWIKSMPGHCINFIDLVLGAQAFNVAFDIAILILPISAIYKLHLRPLKKVGVMAVFAVGTFTIVSAIIRIGVITNEVVVYGPTLPDVTWFTSKWTWTILDPAIGCFVACMPTWSPLMKPVARVIEYASLLRSTFTRSRLTRSSRSRSTSGTKLEDGTNEQNYYLSKYTHSATRDVTIRPSGSLSSQQELHPNAGVAVRKDFIQVESRRFNK